MSSSKKRTTATLVKLLKKLAKSDDYESAHYEADHAIIDFIAVEHPEIAEAWNEVGKYRYDLKTVKRLPPEWWA